MKRMDRYMMGELIPVFLYSVLALTSLFIGAGAVYKIVRFATDFHVGASVVAELIALKLPEVAAYTMPMATLVCILIAFNRLSNDLEITAFRAAGISFLRLVIPVLIFALFVSLLGVLINDRAVPACNAKYYGIIRNVKRDAQHLLDEARILVRTRDGDTERILYAKRIRGSRLDDVSLIEFKDGVLQTVTHAPSAEWAGRLWRFEDSSYVSYSGSEHNACTFTKPRRAKVTFNLTPLDIQRRSESSETGDLSLRQIREWIKLLEKSGAPETDVRKMMVDYHSKMAIPFAAFIFALIAAPLGLRPHRASTFLGMGLSGLIIFFYYISQQLCRGLGQSVMPPFLAAWLPNFIMCAIGAWLLAKSNQ